MTNPIHFLCPHCCTRLRAPASAVGRRAACKCGRTVTVPSKAEIKEVVVRLVCASMATESVRLKTEALAGVRLLGIEAGEVSSEVLRRVMNEV